MKTLIKSETLDKVDNKIKSLGRRLDYHQHMFEYFDGLSDVDRDRHGEKFDTYYLAWVTLLRFYSNNGGKIK